MSTSDSSHDNSADKQGRDESSGRTETRTTETTETDVLTAEEEQVIRMRRGLAEGDDHELDFSEDADEATTDKLRQLEAFLVEAFGERETSERYLSDAEYGAVDPADESGEADADEKTKQKIIDSLSDD